MESWRIAFRDGLAPLLTLKGLVCLATALEADDPQVEQGCTTLPVVGDCGGYFDNWPCQGACPLAFALWHGEGLDTVTDVQEAYLRVCQQAGERLGDLEAVGAFVRWCDETERANMRRLLLIEAEGAIVDRRLPLAG